MTIQHKREPYDYSDADYVGFTEDVEQFLGDDRSLPDRPDHLIAQQAATGAAYRATYVAMNAALGLRKQASDTIANTVKLLKKKLNWMKTVLPTLSDESILLSFGLDKPVPVAYSEIKAMADAADVYWQTVALDPLYAPFADGCNELAPLIAIYDSARATQVAADGEYSQRQNEKDLARAAHHEVERDIFTIYTATYPDPYDDYWTNTPWGKASGGESGETGTSFSDKPIAKIMKAPYPLNGISAGCEEYSGTTRFDYRIAWAQKGEGVPPMSEEDYMTDVEQPTLLDVELMFGYVYYEWIRARKDGEVSEWSDVASYEWNG